MGEMSETFLNSLCQLLTGIAAFEALIGVLNVRELVSAFWN